MTQDKHISLQQQIISNVNNDIILCLFQNGFKCTKCKATCKNKNHIRRWDSERELFYDNIIHLLESTIDWHMNSAIHIALSQCLL